MANTRKFGAFEWGIVALVIIVLSLATYYFSVVIPQGELGQKAVGAALTGVEFQFRKNSDTQTPILLENANGSGFSMLGLPTNDKKFPRVWIVLNENASDSSVKTLPRNMKFYVQCSFVSDIVSKTKVDNAAALLLKKTCNN